MIKLHNICLKLTKTNENTGLLLLLEFFVETVSTKDINKPFQDLI